MPLQIKRRVKKMNEVVMVRFISRAVLPVAVCFSSVKVVELKLAARVPLKHRRIDLEDDLVDVGLGPVEVRGAHTCEDATPADQNHHNRTNRRADRFAKLRRNQPTDGGGCNHSQNNTTHHPDEHFPPLGVRSRRSVGTVEDVNDLAPLLLVRWRQLELDRYTRL